MLIAKKNSIALSLGGGGARGYAHIGVIKELKQHGYDIVAIAGTSMGSVIGALYAAGKLDEFEAWARKLTKLDVVTLMDFSIGKAGAIKAERIFKVIEDLLEGTLIEDLPIPFAAVASDLIENTSVIFESGPVSVALRASVAIPGVITPVIVDGRLLGDGGLVNPVPIEPLVKVRAKKIIAVDLAHGRLVNPFEKELSEPFLKQAINQTLTSSREKVAEVAALPSSRKIAKQLGVDTSIQQILHPAEESPLKKMVNDVPKAIRSTDVISLGIQTMQQKLTQIEFEKYRPDLVIGLPMDACGILEFDRANEMIELGAMVTRQALMTSK